ncbi:uncharacterized protein [Anabrus simplex]|uniref:uncharacterized protein n=1 Tax=Anabrus simplex TaxID=316456 RepID=UPI0035A344BD
MPPPVSCRICDKTFPRMYNLKRHISIIHPGMEYNPQETRPVMNPPVNLFSCQFCEKSFPRAFNLKRHISNIQPGGEYNPVETVSCLFKCAICQQDCYDLDIYKEHVCEAHDITIKTESHEFLSESEFSKWKQTVEHKDNASFVIHRQGKTLCDNSFAVTFYCHRSGKYRTNVLPESRQRESKIQGTSKTGGYCPAKINAVFKNGHVAVEFCSTHIGHQNELAKLSLGPAERSDLATKIAMKVSHGDILDQVRSSVSKDNLKREHLITKQDLYNIERAFSLNSDAVRHPNDAVSVDAWVETEKQLGSNSVLFYKPQNVVLPEYPFLSRNDFFLAIFTEAQQEMLQKFGSDCICVDSTHGLNAYGFEMVTVLVLDDLRQGLPCAFFISSKIDSATLRVFFSCIKERAGVISCNVFMSDMAESFYNAWQEVMGESNMRLFCTWHVIRAWKRNLTKIKDTEKQKLTFERLRSLLHETDEATFNLGIDEITRQLLEDEETKDFGLYFQQRYARCCKAWAYCHRLNSGINTNMHLEAMHRTLKHVLLKGQPVKRLDKAIHAIMQLVKAKLFDRLVVIEKGKVTAKLRDLRDRHKKSLQLRSNLVSENGDGGWAIASSNVPQLYYTVRLVQPDCSCSITCTHCKACIHKFSCTCIDASIKWNMCKHIHLLCRTLAPSECTIQSSGSANMGEEHIVAAERNAILNEVGNGELISRPAVVDIARLRADLTRQFNNVLLKVNNVEQYNICSQSLKRLVPLLNASEQHIATLPQTKSNVSKKIELQRRFKCTRQKFKGKKTSRAQTMPEAINTAASTIVSQGND